MSINKLNLEPSTANLILLNTHKATLSSVAWDFKLLPAVKYAEYMAERSAVYEEHRGDRERIISFCADIYNAWEAKDIPLCVKIDDRQEATLVDINEAITEMEMRLTFQELRAASYPPMADYLDGIVKGDTVQVAKYVSDCAAVKVKYPKG
jgi:hypothetical protein